MALNRHHARIWIAVLPIVLVAAGCGGGGTAGGGSSTTAGTVPSSPTTAPPVGATLPAGWKRCTNRHLGFSVGYPAGWHTDSIRRLRSPRTTAAYKRRFFRQFKCTSFDPRPFMLVDGSELPTTAIEVSRQPSVREATRYRFDPANYRVLSRQVVHVGTHRALRYETYTLTRAMYSGTYTYGYVISMGRRGAIVIEARRFPFRNTSRSAYLHYQHIADQMAHTARMLAATTD